MRFDSDDRNPTLALPDQHCTAETDHSISDCTTTKAKMFESLRLSPKQSRQRLNSWPQPTSIDIAQPRRRSILVHRDDCQAGPSDSSKAEEQLERPERHVHFALPPLTECTNEEPDSPTSSDGCLTPVDSIDETSLLESSDQVNKFALHSNQPPSATTARSRFMSYLNALRLHC
jgi:hypothetical protein